MGLCCGVVHPHTHGKGDDLAEEGSESSDCTWSVGWLQNDITRQVDFKGLLFIFEVVLPKSRDLLSLLPTLIFLVTST